MSELLHCRLLAAGLRAEEKRSRSSLLSLVMILALLTAVFVALGVQHGATAKLMLQFSLAMLGLIAYLAVWYPRRMRRRLTKCWDSYDLEIGHDYLLRRQADIPDLRLQFDEVQAVEHVRGRGLRVIGKTKSHAIAIPESLDHFDQVLGTVSAIRPVRTVRIERWQKQRAFMAAALLLFVVMLWATSPVVVIPLSLAMGSVIVWVCFWVRRNPNIPESQKWIAWVYWLFFAVCVLKLFAAAVGAESVKPFVTGGKIVGDMFVFSPCLLLIFGWVRWWRVRPVQSWRCHAIAWGLATASISALCLYGVLSCIQLANIGHSNEHRLAIAGACVGFPLSVFSIVAAVVGNGRSRVIAGLVGASLAVVWGVAYFYA